MTQEPWCLTADKIARMTDAQMEFLYAEPAVRRQADADAEAKGLPAPSAARRASDFHFDAGELPAKAEFVTAMAALQGGTAAEWAARWDDMAAAVEAERAAEAAK